MPYDVMETDACPAGKPWGVMKAGSEKPMGCHESKDEAMQQMKALMANEPGMHARPEPMVYRSLPITSDYEIRAGDDGARHFTGYAAVFGADSEPLPFIESIQAGAFTRSLNADRDHTFVMDHDDTKLLASRRAKTLRLTEDTRGLQVEADLPDTSYARDLVELHARGEARSMSFTFRVTRGGDTWSADMKRRDRKSVV